MKINNDIHQIYETNGIIYTSKVGVDNCWMSNIVYTWLYNVSKKDILETNKKVYKSDSTVDAFISAGYELGLNSIYHLKFIRWYLYE